MARSTVTIDGFKDLEARLKALPDNVARRGTMRAMRKAAGKMQAAVEERIPVATGNLAGSIRIKAKSSNTAGLAEYASILQGGGSYRDAQQALRAARVGTSGAGTRIVVEVASYAPHAHLVEFGSVERFHKSGKSVGQMPMNPFFRPAFDSTAGACAMAIRDELKIEIGKMEVRQAKLAAKAGAMGDG